MALDQSHIGVGVIGGEDVCVGDDASVLVVDGCEDYRDVGCSCDVQHSGVPLCGATSRSFRGDGYLYACASVDFFDDLFDHGRAVAVFATVDRYSAHGTEAPS